MRILALDTTGEYGSIALVEDDRIVEEVPLHSPDGYGHVLFGEIGGVARAKRFWPGSNGRVCIRIRDRAPSRACEWG